MRLGNKDKEKEMINEFSRTELLIGTEAEARVRDASVMVFGVGGVGSHCIEAPAAYEIPASANSSGKIMEYFQLTRVVMIKMPDGFNSPICRSRFFRHILSHSQIHQR